MLAKTENKKNPTKNINDSPILDLNNSAIKSLIKKGKSNGFVTLDDKSTKLLLLCCIVYINGSLKGLLMVVDVGGVISISSNGFVMVKFFIMVVLNILYDKLNVNGVTIDGVDVTETGVNNVSSVLVYKANLPIYVELSILFVLSVILIR